jgi:tetratricopeptide (TPR) repeat protein
MFTSVDCRAARRDGVDAKAYNQQAVASLRQGKLEEALTFIDQALRLEPDYAGAHVNRGNILALQGRFESALEDYGKALRLKPDFAEAYCNRSNALTALGRYEEAVRDCQQALRLQPKNPSNHNSLGNAYKGLRKLAEAVDCYQQALRINPAYAEACNNLGAVLADLDRLEEAIAFYRDALCLKPDFAEAFRNLAAVLLKRSQWEEAVVLLQHVLRLRPNFAEAYDDLGFALGAQGRLEEAAHSYEQAIRLKPDYAPAHGSLAFNCLQRGDFERGWAELEWRRRLQKQPRFFQRPVWDGGCLTGRTILLHAEWGLGDTIQFIRYAKLVKNRGGAVIVECQPALLPLLASAPGIDRLVAAGSALPPFDVHAALLSLPGILKTTLSNVPADIPYLSADARLQRRWRRRLGRYPGFKIGIAWQGNSNYKRDPQRSIPLRNFAPLSRIPGVCLLSIQKGVGTAQLDGLADRFRLLNLGSPGFDEESGAFMDTAAIMKNVDLVITCDTSIAHLAGALGVPVWVALPFAPDWRWLRDREDSPWYPTMRLFRQSKPGDWEGVFERMAQELSKKVAATQRQIAVTVPVAAGELIDKITILELKAEKIRDRSKLAHVQAELQALQAVRDREMERSKEMARITSQLKAVNRRLWRAEDEIRRCEEAKDFGPRFIKLARSIYQHNDRRSALKRQINELLGSAFVEEKAYG